MLVSWLYCSCFSEKMASGGGNGKEELSELLPGDVVTPAGYSASCALPRRLSRKSICFFNLEGN